MKEMMTRWLLMGLVLLAAAQVSAQIFNPVKWTMAHEKVSDTEYDLIFTANIQQGWVVYSQEIGDDGPVPTSFNFDAGSHFERVGKTKEAGNRKEAYDKVFEMNLIKFSGKGTFTQRVKVSDRSKPIKGYLEFMTCDDERCLPPTEVDFSFDLSAAPGSGAATPAKQPEAPATKTPEATKAADVADMAATEQPPVPATLPTAVPGGIEDPVHWTGSVSKTAAGSYELTFNAVIDKGWAIYSQFTEDNGPVPTYFHFEEGAHYSRQGKVEEKGKKKEGFDPVFGVNVIKYEAGQVAFTQQISAAGEATPISGYLTYMACDDEKCLPPADMPFRVDLAKLQVLMGDAASQPADAAGPGAADAYGLAALDLSSPVSQCGEVATVSASSSYWNILLLGFLGGLLALLTPCVFPMVPLTVSYFTKGSENRQKGMFNAFMYGFFIFAVYVILSIPFHLMDSIDSDILNQISTNVWLNIAFFVIFLFFAFSFFGYYELTLPSSWVNKASAAEGVGGMLGIFFMALTLALVSFSCTGPILGSLLAGALSSSGGAMQLTMGMAGFGLALALPFAMFAAFPSMMSALPKSGGWLTSVKVVLGFLELALALKFLSNADLVKHWGLLKIEPFLGLWMLIFLAMGLYLFGVIRFPKEPKLKKLSPLRAVLGAATMAFVLYLGSGFIYNDATKTFRPLTLLSGLAPPVGYSWIYPNDCPQNLTCFKDLEEGLAFARKNNKPVMIDFTGYACVNCRKMEEHVWPEQPIYNRINNDYVLISLYVDEKVELPEAEQVTVDKSTGGTRRLRNYGHKWAHFQEEFFKINSQPYYVLLTPEGQLLNNPVGYTPDVEAYLNFLDCGVEAFDKLKGKGLLGEQ